MGSYKWGYKSFTWVLIIASLLLTPLGYPRTSLQSGPPEKEAYKGYYSDMGGCRN